MIAAGEGIFIWDSHSGQKLDLLAPRDVFRIALRPDGDQLAVGKLPVDLNNLSLWDLKGGRELAQLPSIWLETFDIEYSPDGLHLATSSSDCQGRVWSVERKLVLYTIGESGGPQLVTDCVFDMAFNPDGKHLVTGGADGTLRVLEATSGQDLLAMKAETDILSVAISPDGNLIASGEADGTVIVWDMGDGQGRPLFNTVANSGIVNRLAFSPDGKLLASASADKTAKVWGWASTDSLDTETDATAIMQELVTLSAHKDIVSDIAFSPEGRRLVTASKDGTARMVTSDLEELVTLAKERITRSLTEAECRQYLHTDTCPTSP